MNRSFHFVPGHERRFLDKIPGLEADHVVLELEDGVANTDKETARRNVVEYLSTAPERSYFVRINRIGSDEGNLDVQAIAGLRSLPGIVLPKVERREDIEDLILSLGIKCRGLPVIPLFESFSSLAQISAVSGDPRVFGVGLGLEDMLADTVHAPTDLSGLILAVKSKIVLAAKSAGIVAIDTISKEISNSNAFASECVISRGLGFDGRFVIHPVQISSANAVYGVSGELLDWAEKILLLSQGNETGGYQRIDGRIISGPMVTKAKTISKTERIKI